MITIHIDIHDDGNHILSKDVDWEYIPRAGEYLDFIDSANILVLSVRYRLDGYADVWCATDAYKRTDEVAIILQDLDYLGFTN